MSPEKLSEMNSESGHQKAVFAWCAMAINRGVVAADDPLCYSAFGYADKYSELKRVPELWLLHAIPNGGARDTVTAARMKAEGVKAGVPDMHLPVSRHGYHSLYIELKPVGNRKPSKEQEAFNARLIEEGNAVSVAHGWKEVVSILMWYLGF